MHQYLIIYNKIIHTANQQLPLLPRNQHTRADQGQCWYSAPDHCACTTIEYLSQATPDFISLDLWPPNSRDPNPVDYKIWGDVLKTVFTRRAHTTSMSWNSAWWMFGETLGRQSLMGHRWAEKGASGLCPFERTPIRTCLV